MNVLLTADTVGGVLTFALELVRGLAARGVRVTLATMGAEPTPDQRAQIEAARAARVETASFALEWMDDPWHDVDRAGEWLLRLADESGADVVHLNGYAHAALPWRRPVVVTAHSDVLSWFEAVRGEAAPDTWDEYRRRVAEGLAAADVVTAPTRAMLDTLVYFYRPRGDTLVIPNGRSLPAGPRCCKEEFVLAAGRMWDEAKNLGALKTVAPRLPWHTEIVGEGGPVGRVATEDLVDRMRRAAIFASPARYEPFGLSALEAALSGCALVLGDIPSLREVWGDAAAFVPPDDVALLERALRRLISDGDLRTQAGEAARARAARYTPERMTDGYVAAYERVLARQRAPLAR
jgi:glycosyltransferase involved in cell wall biosynthesis